MKLLVGCGKMGGAILEGWLQDDMTDIVVLTKDEEQSAKIRRMYQVETIFNLDQLQVEPQTVLVAVKPYHLEKVLPTLSKFKDAVFISVVVGTSIEYFQSFLGTKCTVVRTMPNIPCLIKQGVIGIYSNKKMDDIDKLLSTVGKTFWLENEEQIDMVAALPGGMPAFFVKILQMYAKSISELTSCEEGVVMNKIVQFLNKQKKMLVVEQILNGWVSDAVILGLKNEMAHEMMIRTVVGTIELLQSMSGDDIIQAVASKKGTTEAGLKAIDYGLSPVVAAYRRALEINAVR